MRLTFVLVADLPPGGAPAFSRYEAAVLPLLARHGGRLERRLRTDDGLCEVHVVSFDSREGYDGYLADEQRRRARTLLDGVDVAQRLLEVRDVED